MGCFTVARAITVRVMFTAHGIFSIWRLYVVTNDAKHWYLAMALFGLIFETAVTLYKKRGQDWKWFCPSVFFYLSCLVPTIWFLELHELEVRIQNFNANATTAKLRDIVATMSHVTLDPDEDTYPEDEDDISGKLEHIIGGTGFNQYQWVRTLEQLLLLILILGRWLLPKGKLTHDQLSQLLLVYIGTAADIVEFFEAFNETEVKHNRDLCKVILAIWSWSVLQFTLVFTATKARKESAGAIARESSVPVDPSGSCCTPDVFGIIMSIFMQDGPFLVLRLLLIFKYNVLSYTNMFFTCKNTLVCMLLLYRLIVIQLERYQLIKASEGDGGTMKESSSRAKLLLLSAGNTDQYYNYSTKVILRETSSDANEVTVTYVIRRHMSLPPEPGSSAVGGGGGEDGEGGGGGDDDSVEDVRTLYETESLVFPGDFELHSVRSDATNGGFGALTARTTSLTPTTPSESRVIDVDEREALVDPGQRTLDRIIAGAPTDDAQRVFCDSDSDDSVMASLVMRPRFLGNTVRTQRVVAGAAVPSALALTMPATASATEDAHALQCNNSVTTVVELHHHHCPATVANNSSSCNSLNNVVGHTNLHFEQSPTLENVVVQ